MSHQSALLKFFHEELERPNPVANLEQKLQATKAAAEKQVQALTKEQDILKLRRRSLKPRLLQQSPTLTN
jgi:hypothetical protein